MTPTTKEEAFARFIELTESAIKEFQSLPYPKRPANFSRRADLLAAGMESYPLLAERLETKRSKQEFFLILEGVARSKDAYLARVALPISNHGKPAERLLALQALGSADPNAFRRRLIRALSDPHPDVRMMALSRLWGAIHNRRPSSTERRILMDLATNVAESQPLRFLALELLGIHGGYIYARFLQELVQRDPSSEVREEAALCLKEEKARQWRIRYQKS